jgi:hypothetical protein
MKKITTLRLISGLALAVPFQTFAVRAHAQEPVALVVRVTGDVDVRHGANDPGPASIGEQMFAGDGVIPSAGARAILLTRTGGAQVITEAETLGGTATAGSSDLFARTISTLAQAASTDATMGGRQGMIRPLTCGIAPVGPRNNLLVAASRPTFGWTPYEGQVYDLMVRNVAGGRPQIFEVGTDTAFTIPEGSSLDLGATYEWTIFVGGRRTGRACQPMRFRVNSLEESVELDAYLEDISVFGLDPMGDGLFLTVMAYRDLGLFYDARDALLMVEEQATLSADLYLLKGEILAELGQEEAARRAFDMADELMR